MHNNRIPLIAAATLVLSSCATSAPVTPAAAPPPSTAALVEVAPTEPAAPVAPSPLSQVEIFTETLPNGFRVLLARTPPSQGPRVYVASYIFHGVLQEERLGWAHLMEHIAANNRSAIPGPPIPTGVEAFNGNALARPYYTSFVLIAPRAMVPSLVHGRMAKAGMTQNDPAVFTEELGRVVTELERDSSSQYAAYSALAALSAGAPPGAAAELRSVRSATRPEVEAMIRKHYRPEAAALAVVGDIDIAETRQAVLAASAKLGWTARRAPEPLRGPRAGQLVTGRSIVLRDQNKGEHTVVGVGWPRPDFAAGDRLALLVANQLLLGGHDDPKDPKRSDASPLGRRLGQSLQAFSLWDRLDNWATPPLAETGPAVQAVLFNTRGNPAPAEVAAAVATALRDIRATETSDAAIEAAKAAAARFYEGWLLDPDHRILGDHLIAWSAAGADPRQVLDLPAAIRRVDPGEVRAALDRYLLAVSPLVAVLPAASGQGAGSND